LGRCLASIADCVAPPRAKNLRETSASGTRPQRTASSFRRIACRISSERICVGRNRQRRYPAPPSHRFGLPCQASRLTTHAFGASHGLRRAVSSHSRSTAASHRRRKGTRSGRCPVGSILLSAVSESLLAHPIAGDPESTPPPTRTLQTRQTARACGRSTPGRWESITARLIAGVPRPLDQPT
jgi:hypothetical protein